MPSEGEAVRLLEERKRVHIPDESKRVIPPKKKEVEEKEKKEKKEKERKRRRDSSSHANSATKRASVDTIRTFVPLHMRLAEGEVSTPQGKALPVSGKGKEKVGESATASESCVEEVYHRREVLPFLHDTFFSELDHKGMITRFNRASTHLISRKDVDHLESLPPSDRVRQLQASAVEVSYSVSLLCLM